MNDKAPARFHLVGSNAQLGAIDLALPEGDSVLGRDPSCDFTLAADDLSRRHAQLTVAGDSVVVRDMHSTNGTYVNGDRIEQADVHPGDRIRFGPVTVELTGEVAAAGRAENIIAASAEGTRVVQPAGRDPGATQLIRLEAEPPALAAASERGIVGQDLLSQPVISEQQLREHGIDVEVTTFAAAGGGMGSFVWTDLLRVSGVPAERIAVIGTEQAPYARYQRLCNNSQIPSHERLRSNSDSCPDNVWGYPGYATREIWGSLRRSDFRLAGRLAWQIFGEPALTQTYTPRSGDVFRSLDRESERIGWQKMFRFGRIRAIRRSAEGRLLVIASASTANERRHYAIAADCLHLAIGYPAIQLLPDLATYRETNDDRKRVVNAYEEHGHVYEQLRAKGGTVVLRGRGIVASRILQRLYEERRHNPKISVVHLHRSRLTAGHTYGRSHRGVELEFEFQPFNWPKGSWTGQQRRTMEEAGAEERAHLLETWGGTTTADRRDWKRILREGAREGWYRAEYGVVKELTPSPDGRVVTRISNSLAGGGILELPADFVIDCTGLIASPDRSPVLRDLIDTYQLEPNKLGRLQVTNDFEVAGTRHAAARMYAAGAITLGGPHAAVDSFLGLQYAAYRAVDAIQREHPELMHKLNGLYSASQWWRWARGGAP